MRRGVAEKIIRLVKTSDELLGKLGALTGEIEDDAERKSMRRTPTELICDVHEKIISQDRRAVPGSASRQRTVRCLAPHAWMQATKWLGASSRVAGTPFLQSSVASGQRG